MPRTRLYHTPEQKKAANREKSRRNYQKHKSDILRQRRAAYKKTRQSVGIINTCFDRRNLPGSLKLKKPTTLSGERSESEECIRYWVRRVSQVATRFNKLTNNSVFGHLEGLLANFKTSRNQDVFRDAILVASPLQKSIYSCEEQILQLAGVGPELAQAECVSKCVSDLIRWLEEMLCLAMADAEELLEAHERQSLMYQT